MGETLERRIARYARDHGLLPSRRPVLAQVSGGADSTCLMHLLATLHDGLVGVVTFDHGLRPESAGETADVAAAAAALGLPVWVERLRVLPGAGVQERAREARRAAAERLAAEHGFTVTATGHTASDQAETVLFRMARGSGRTGALGMAPRMGALVRPLLCVTAAETRAWCAERGLAVALDPSNEDPAYARTRVRRTLLPALDAVHPGAERAVARFADQLREEAEVLDVLVDAAWGRAATGAGLRVDVLAAEHPALARLLVRRLLSDAGIGSEAAWISRALELGAAGGGPIQAPGGGVIAVDGGVMVAEPAPRTPPQAVELAVPGSVTFGDRRLRAGPGRADEPGPTRVALSVDGPFTVRSPRPGDRLALGPATSQPVGRLLAVAGVPARHRPHVPVVVSAGRIVWVAGYRADPNVLAQPAAPATVLEVHSA
jgi:tRNA(Ile)-lysidine synthase